MRLNADRGQRLFRRRQITAHQELVIERDFRNHCSRVTKQFTASQTEQAEFGGFISQNFEVWFGQLVSVLELIESGEMIWRISSFGKHASVRNRSSSFVGGVLASFGEHEKANKLVADVDVAGIKMASAHEFRLSVSIASDDHAESLQQLTALRDDYGYQFSDLSKVPEYKAFSESPQHKTWMEE